MGENNPLVSVIMPAYNAEKYIGEAISSILNQTYGNWELLICDDGSTDRTYDKILKFKDKRIKFISKTPNLGAFAAKNFLLKSALGEFITFQDADDFVDPKRIELQLKELLNFPELGMVGCQVGIMDEKGNLIRTSKKPKNYKMVLDSIYNQNVIGGAIMMIRRGVLNKVGGGFRDYFKNLSYQDYDLSILIAERYPCYNLSNTLYFYRQHSASTSKILSIDRLLAKEVVIILAKQRKERGTDDLIDGNTPLVDNYFENLRQPYILDSSLIYRKYAADYMFNNLYVRAIATAWQGLVLKPLNVRNWRTLQYCIRKFILSRLK